MRREWIPLFLITAVAAVCVYWFGIRAPEPATGDARPDAAIVIPVYPIGPLKELPVEFRWRGPSNTRKYRVAVYDQGMNEIWAMETRDQSLAFPGELVATLRDGETLFFRVRALGRMGKLVAESEHVFFRLDQT